jgi:hypothetical protein
MNRSKELKEWTLAIAFGLTIYYGISLWPASKEYSKRFAKLEKFVDKNQVGSNGDVWLVKTTFMGTDKVALIFGLPNNMLFCLELAESQNQLYPGANVFCLRADQY